jgi:hypothetical protein
MVTGVTPFKACQRNWCEGGVEGCSSRFDIEAIGMPVKPSMTLQLIFRYMENLANAKHQSSVYGLSDWCEEKSRLSQGEKVNTGRVK